MRYFRRFRMEFTFAERDLPEPVLPPGYWFVPWDPLDIERYSQVKYASFQGGMDARIFPSLATLDGCRNLMAQIAMQLTFLPEATWMISCEEPAHVAGRSFATAGGEAVRHDCGVIQGLAHNMDSGAIQNVGVHPDYRGLGLGRALVIRALQGYREMGLKRVYLEATAENVPAVELYRSIGFRLVRTTFKAVTGGDDSA